MSWDIVIGNKSCPWRKEIKRPEDEPLYECKLSGGSCEIENCEKKFGPEDGL